MPEFNYVLSFDPWSENPQVGQVQNFVQNHKAIIGWFIPFEGTIIFKSNLALIDLMPSFYGNFLDKTFVITYAAPSFVGGSLPQVVWDWMNRPQVAGIGATK